jgi:predicted ATP-dependent protease
LQEEVIIPKENLVDLFKSKRIIETDYGWYLNSSEIEIIALHEIEPKFLRDVANAKLYKLKRKDGKSIII